MGAHGMRRHVAAAEAPRQNGPVEGAGGAWEEAAGKAIADAGAEGFAETWRLAAAMNLAGGPRANASGISPAQW
eukprot:1264352-Pyramimonas_sp.AAC.1